MHNANQTVPAEYRNAPRLTNIQATHATRSNPRTLANKIPRSGNGRISHQVNGKSRQADQLNDQQPRQTRHSRRPSLTVEYLRPSPDGSLDLSSLFGQHQRRGAFGIQNPGFDHFQNRRIR